MKLLSQKLLFQTDENIAGLVARVCLGVVIFPHGLPKLMTFEQTMNGFTNGLGLPTVVAFLVIIGESIGAISLILGFMSRFCAFSIGIIMVGVAWIFHFENGFFMNWRGNLNGEGYEYFILAVGLALVVTFSGGGKFSLDRLITRSYLR